MKVSIIIPLYNSETHISQTISSCLDQTYKDIEIIIIDDGSTDRSAEVVTGFSSHLIKYHYQENSGASSARNKGLELASGDYIQYLDSDDVLHPQKIEKQINEIKDLPNTVASCSWGKFRDQVEESIIEEESVWKDYSFPANWLIDSWLGGGMMQTACWLLPANLVQAAGPWNEQLSLHDDGEYFTRILLEADSIIYLKESMVHYRQIPGSLSRRRSSEAAISAFEVVDLSVKHLLKKVDSETARNAAARHYGKFAYEFILDYPDLAIKAVKEIDRYSASSALDVGPDRFNKLARIIGLRRALQLKRVLKRRYD